MKRMKRAQDAETTAATTSYSEIAAVMLQALETISSVMPASELTQGLHIPYVRRRLGVSREMIASAITASGVSPRFQGIMDEPEARDTLALYDALQPVFVRMAAVSQDLRFTIEARVVKTGGEALDIYAAAKRVAQDPDEQRQPIHLPVKPSRISRSPIRRSPPSALGVLEAQRHRHHEADRDDCDRVTHELSPRPMNEASPGGSADD